MTKVNSDVPCFICGSPLRLGVCRLSKAGKKSLSICCSADGRHLKGFIAHLPLVEEILDRLQMFADGEINSPESVAESDGSQPPIEESDAC